MKKIFKISGVVLVVLVVAIAGTYFYFVSNVDRIVANLIEERGSMATGTPVRVDDVSIDIGEARGTVRGLSVGNPSGFSRKPAIEFGDIALSLDAGSLFSDSIVIKSAEVGDATLRIEQVGATNNLQTVLDNLRGEADGKPADPAGPRLIVDRFVLNGASASLSLPDLHEQRSVDVPDIVLTGIGRESGGVTGAELGRQVLEPIIRESLESAATQAAKEKVRDELEDRAGDLLDRFGSDQNDEDSGSDERE